MIATVTGRDATVIDAVAFFDVSALATAVIVLEPGVSAVTTPVALTEATAGLLEDSVNVFGSEPVAETTTISSD